MGEVGVARGQIELLAALFHADGPNDVAPSAYNLPDLARAAREPAHAPDGHHGLPLGVGRASPLRALGEGPASAGPSSFVRLTSRIGERRRARRR